MVGRGGEGMGGDGRGWERGGGGGGGVAIRNSVVPNLNFF